MSWQAWLGVYLAVGLTIELTIQLYGALAYGWAFEPISVALTAVFWPFLVLGVIGLWAWASIEGMSLDKTTDVMRAGATYQEIEQWLHDHPDASEEEHRRVRRQIVQKQKPG